MQPGHWLFAPHAFEGSIPHAHVKHEQLKHWALVISTSLKDSEMDSTTLKHALFGELLNSGIHEQN